MMMMMMMVECGCVRVGQRLGYSGESLSSSSVINLERRMIGVASFTHVHTNSFTEAVPSLFCVLVVVVVVGEK